MTQCILGAELHYCTTTVLECGHRTGTHFANGHQQPQRGLDRGARTSYFQNLEPFPRGANDSVGFIAFWGMIKYVYSPVNTAGA